jgi:Bacterial SH3 domain
MGLLLYYNSIIWIGLYQQEWRCGMSFTPKYLSQRDPRWINEKLGFNDAVTIGTDGSALVCLSMLVNGYGYSETPSSMNRRLKDLGSGIGFLGSLIVWPGLTLAFPKVIFQRTIVCRDRPAPLDEINTSLDARQPLLVEIDRSPSPGLQNHWVILYARQEEDYLMLDPWPQPPDNAPITLKVRYGMGRAASEVITTVAWYAEEQGPAEEAAPATLQGSIPAPAPQLTLAHAAAAAPQPVATVASKPTALPAAPAASGELILLVSQSVGQGGLRLRDAPSENGIVVSILPAGTQLTSLEPAGLALPKSGQAEQWLNVRDENGRLGYVAAGYVEARQVPAPSQELKLMTVLVSSQASAGLRLRDRPSEKGNTLEILKPGTLLTVLEPAATAQAKIGVVNQWLNVKRPGGMTGYVAAWYVTN